MAMPPPPPPPPPPPMSQSRLEEGGRPGEPPALGFVVYMNVVNTITHLLFGAVAFSAFFFVNTPSIIFLGSLRMHIYLCVTGYVIVMTQAILTFNPYTGWASNLKYPQKRTVHWILQICGSALAIAGSGVMLSDMNPNNLQTAHGIVGFIAMLLTVVSLVGGIVNLICPQKVKTVIAKTLHAGIGSLTLSMAFAALCLGFDNIRLFIGDINTNLSISFAVIALVGTLFMTFANMARRGCSFN